MESSKLKEIFTKFENLTALVIGDVMIDSYLWGRVDRISPEAPVPVVQVTKKENRLGGAANVALNVAALGANPVICAVTGKDLNGDIFDELLISGAMSTAGILHSSDRSTTVKTRVISDQQHIVRVDEESLKPLTTSEENAFIKRVEKVIQSQNPGVIIFEDYNKGVLTPRVITAIIALAEAHKIPTAVDPKKENFFAYKSVTLFKPNLKELVEGLKTEVDKKDLSTLESAVLNLEAKINNQISLITLSEMGVYVKDKTGSHQIPAHIRNISDVSGAGDTVISVAALCLALGVETRAMAALANLAGGLVCEEVGVVPIDKNRLFAEAEKVNLSS